MKYQQTDYIAATKIYNYILNDPLVDWIKEHKRRTTRNNTNKFEGFNSFIMDKGIEFEKEIVKIIDTKIPVVSVSEYITNDTINKTIELMKQGVPLIHSAPVRNPKNRTHGVIDLLVRSDYISQLVNECPITDEEKLIKSPKLGHNFHYLVVDIKFSTLPLRSDGKHLLNSGRYPAYKAQCLIYNDAIGLIQGYTSNYSFILGRRWKYTQRNIKHNNISCLDKLGIIDYNTMDNNYKQITKDSIKWVRENKKYGHRWSVTPPSRRELYPNMCYDSGDMQIHKENIATDIGEITSIWNCGVKHRNIALDNGISSWRDPNCNSENIGIRGKRANVIDRILNINRQNTDLILPKKIESNMFNWKICENEMFVDFETISDIFSSFTELPLQKPIDMIFMIGVWYKSTITNNWEYKKFKSKKATYEDEYIMMDEFVKFTKDHNNPKLWFWSAEKKFWNRSEKRQFDMATDNIKRSNISDNWDINTWVDMLELFKQEPIVIKDCFKFGLKHISKAMKKHNLISTSLESECTSGMSAMVKAWKCYKDFEQPDKCPIMQDIAIYNKFDVSVLHDILSYLRNNHT